MRAYIPELGIELNHTPDLLSGCREEMLDPAYLAYQHGVRATRALGCKGPMCMKAARDYGREFQRKRAGATRENASPARVYDDFLAEYCQFAAEQHRARDAGRPPRRTLSPVRIARRDHLVPMTSVQMMHAKRVGLAS